MTKHAIVSQAEWIEARKQFLTKEKEFTRLRDELNRERRELPWVRVDKQYVFEGPEGKETLAELFAGRRQLIVQHFMFDPSWEAGCKSCSFWADGYNGFFVHLQQRDATFCAVKCAPCVAPPSLRKFRITNLPRCKGLYAYPDSSVASAISS
jgi:predicted dithiol-disulfide oxidoreductase (DUF899 family)